MTRSKFLQELRTALSGKISESAVQENVEFYDGYIKEEVRKGMDVEEVLRMLGDPALIARTIIDVPKRGAKRSSGRGAQRHPGKVRDALKLPSWKKAAAIVGCILLSAIASAVLRGFMHFILPIALPVLAVFLIVKKIRKK